MNEQKYFEFQKDVKSIRLRLDIAERIASDLFQKDVKSIRLRLIQNISL